MSSYDPAHERQDCDRILQPFLSHPDLPFADVLTGADIQQDLDKHAVRFGGTARAIFTPALIVWAFLSQRVHKDIAYAAATARLIVLLMSLHRPVGTCDEGGYARARAKIPDVLLRHWAVGVGRRLERQVPDDWLPLGRHVHLVDGFTVQAPDTTDNRKCYPPPPQQKPGLSFPIIRAVLLVSLITGCVLDLAYGPYEGKETGETALFRQLLGEMVAGDVVVFDRYYCSYFMLALARRHGIEVVVRLHQRRTYDFRRGRRLGHGDHVVVWQRPQRPEWMTPEEYESMPATMEVREVHVDVTVPGRRVRSLVVVTTLTDAAEYAKDEIGDLYGQRWHVELDIRTIKGTLQLEYLRSQTPFMIDREIWATMLSYNLVRKVAAQAAVLHGRHPRQISFTGTRQALEAAWAKLSGVTAAEQLAMGQELLKKVSKKRVGNRPNRCEPRAVKRRPKPHKLLMKTRAEAKAELLGRAGQAKAGAAAKSAEPFRC